MGSWSRFATPLRTATGRLGTPRGIASPWRVKALDRPVAKGYVGNLETEVSKMGGLAHDGLAGFNRVEVLEALIEELLDQCLRWQELPEDERAEQAHSSLMVVTERLKEVVLKRDTERYAVPPPVPTADQKVLDHSQDAQRYGRPPVCAQLVQGLGYDVSFMKNPPAFRVDSDAMKAWLEGTWDNVDPVAPTMDQGLANVADFDDLHGECSAEHDEAVRQEMKLAELEEQNQQYRGLLTRIKASLHEPWLIEDIMKEFKG